MRRILPGALVILARDAEVTLVRAPDDGRPKLAAGLLFDSDQKELLRRRLEEARACSPTAVYLVLTASARNALLLRPDTEQYLVVQVGDLTDVGDTEEAVQESGTRG
jgi:hypothetical protein